MCTILLALQKSEQFPLLVLANRDEFYHRPTAAMSEWQEMPGLIAGRDLASGGTWFGVRKQRWASVTNVREGQKQKGQHAHHKSRGWLVLDYLQGDLAPAEYLEKIRSSDDDFAGYNLLLGDDLSICYTSNRIEKPVLLKPGIYGLSNHILDTPWPKVKKGKAALKNLLLQPCLEEEIAFAILADQTLAADKDLPDTGIPYTWEKALSAAFINLPEYGTRCSTMLAVNRENQYRLVERRYFRKPTNWDKSEFTWRL